MTLLALICVAGVANPAHLGPLGLRSPVTDIVPLFIMALGMKFAIYIGGINLAAQQVAKMVTVVATVILSQFGLSVTAICVLAGFPFGAASGFVITRLYVPSFVSTLAMDCIALSAAKYLSVPRALSMDVTGRNASFGRMVESTAGVPHQLAIAIMLLVAAWFLQTRTGFGRALKALGSGELAALASGLNVDRVKILAVAIFSAFAEFTDLLFTVKLSGGDAHLANGFLLLAVVAVLVGGMPLTGGVGGTVNTAIGTLVVIVIRAAMIYPEIEATDQQMVFGLVLIVVIALTIDRGKLSGVVK